MKIHEIILEQELTERASSVLFHYTSIQAAEKILSSKRFELSSSVGAPSETSLAPPGYPYFLSCARSLLGAYHNYIGHAAVMFNLDGDYYNRHYKAQPVDYWRDKTYKNEMEDRIFSKKPTIPIAGVTAVHVYVEPQTEQERKNFSPRAPSLARKVLLAAKLQGFDTYFYEDEDAWRKQDTTKIVPIESGRETLSGSAPSSSFRTLRPYLTPWLELIHHQRTADLGKKAKQYLYDIQYSYNKGDVVKGLGNDMANARKPDGGADRQNVNKIIREMQKHGWKTLNDLVNALAEKWKVIKENERKQK